MPVTAQVAVARAAVTAAAGDPWRAVLLLGIAAAVRGREDTTDPRVRRLLARLRDQLGDDAFSAAYGEGAAMPRSQAVDLLTGAIWPDDEPVRPVDQERRR